MPSNYYKRVQNSAQQFEESAVKCGNSCTATSAHTLNNPAKAGVDSFF